MASVFEVSHKLWVEAQLRAPNWAQKTLIPYLHEAKELMRLRPYLSVHRLCGQSPSGPLTVDYVGLNYKPRLTHALFADEPQAKEIKRIPAWQARTLADLSDSDMVVVIGSKHLISNLPRQHVVILPFFVNMTLDLRGSWEDVQSRIHKNVRKGDFRLIRKYGYEYDLSDRKEDLETYYHTMYLPTITLRKGNLAEPMSLQQAYQYFQHGYLHLIKRDGRYVAGGLSHVQGDTIKVDSRGVIKADEQLMHEGVLAACYYAMIQWANQKGYNYMDFGDCVPRLENGVFQYKRKWGGVATYSDKDHKQIWIKVQRDTLAVRQFFKDNPFIITGPNGKLQGLVVTDDPDKVTEETQNGWKKQYTTPGLDDLLIRSMDDLLNNHLH
jgi:hypothetical protein